MANNLWDKQKEFLQQTIIANQESTKRRAKKSLGIIERNSAASQEESLRNGEPQKLLAVRMKSKEIKITAFPGDELYAGDIVDCFEEKWLVMEAFTNENGIRYGHAWLCNHIFRFQNGTNTIIERYGVIDDGNYMGSKNQSLPLEEGFYRVYLPLDDRTEKIFIGKRFSIGTAFNEHIEPILAVIKVVWIDPKSRNIGEGSHLLSFRFERDVFNTQKDNVEEMVCDFITDKEEPADPPPEPDGTEPAPPPSLRCVIEGRDTIRIGSPRTFTVKVLNETEEKIDASGVSFKWSYTKITGAIFNAAGTQLSVQIPVNISLVGQTLELTVVDEDENFISGTMSVEVID